MTSHGRNKGGGPVADEPRGTLWGLSGWVPVTLAITDWVALVR